MVEEGEDGGSDAAEGIESVAVDHLWAEETEEQTACHCPDGVPGCSVGCRTANGVAVPNPEDHGAAIRKEGVQAKDQTANAHGGQQR